MALFPEVSLTVWNILLSAGILVFGSLGAFIGGLYLFSLDRKTKKFDQCVRRSIREDPAFSGIQDAAEPDIEPTSDSRISKGIILAKEVGGDRLKPDKVVKVEGETMTKRAEEVLRERMKQIPGKTLLHQDVVGALRNYFAFRLAIENEEYSSELAERFKNNLEAYDCSKKIIELGKSEMYEDIILTNESFEEDLDPLNDIFLEFVSAAENCHVGQKTSIDEKERAIEEAREYLMLSLWSLWTKNMRGIKIRDDHDRDTCIDEYRQAAKTNEDWGLWLLACENCDQEEFERIRFLCWRINDIIEEHWENESYSTYFTHGKSIREMEYVERPFAIYHKDEEVVRGGATTAS